MASSEPLWHPEAALEAQEARDWYSARSPLAARGFLLALDHALSAVLEAPHRWPERRFGCRQYVFPNRYPYRLVYRIDDRGVRIIAVAHQGRRPDYWRARSGPEGTR